MLLRHLIAAPLLLAAPVFATLESEFKDEILPIFEDSCYDCHGDGARKGGLDLDDYPGIAKMQADRDTWTRIRSYLVHDLMPPPGEDPLPATDNKRLLAWIDAAVFPVDPDNPDPGHVVLRRLNRIEYQNTVRDLLGVDVDLIEQLPPDDSGYGFDNIGAVLTTSPAHLDRYLECARIALDAAVRPGPMPFPSTKVAGDKLGGDGSGSADGRSLASTGKATATIKVAKAGRYRLVVSASGTPGDDGGPLMELRIGATKQHTWEVEARRDSPADHDFELNLKPGSHAIGAAFTNDYYNPEHPDPARRDRNLFVHSIRLEGPLDGPRLPFPESHLRIFGECSPGTRDADYAAEVIARFTRRAFRRPVRPDELDGLMKLAALRLADGGPDAAAKGVRLALEAVLVSPAFLFREEAPEDDAKAGEKTLISEHALASRLSYFLWSTMPDEALLALADRGELRRHLDREVKRLLDSPRAAQFITHFTGQWLQLRDLRSMSPSRKDFPNFDPGLRPSMRRETEMLFAHIIREDLPLATLLDADFTFADEKLAKFYGIKGVKGGKFNKVPLAGTPRRGLLGHGSFLLVTSHSNRTSPVLRGKFVLENLLDSGPPPPPPNVPELEAPGKDGKGLTLRQQLERHREDPACASCHAMMDPIGFGLQNFDADGRWRDQEAGKPVDASGRLSTGESFVGPDQLRQILTGPKLPDFHRAVAAKLLTYALGRGVEWFDKPAIDRIVREADASGGLTRTMIRSVIHSVPFQYSRPRSGTL